MNVLYYYANPYDINCKATLQTLFDNKVYPLVIERIGAQNDKGFWISYLPTVILADSAGKEWARLEDVPSCTPANVAWLRDNADGIIAGTISKTAGPTGVKFA